MVKYDSINKCSGENALYMVIDVEKPLFFKEFPDFDDEWECDLGENRAEFLGFMG